MEALIPIWRGNGGLHSQEWSNVNNLQSLNQANLLLTKENFMKFLYERKEIIMDMTKIKV